MHGQGQKQGPQSLDRSTHRNPRKLMACLAAGAACLIAGSAFAAPDAAAPVARQGVRAAPPLPADLVGLANEFGSPPASGTAPVTASSARDDFEAFLKAGEPKAASLPDAVRADMVIQYLRRSLAGGRIMESLDHIGEYRALGRPLPMAMLLLEARLAAMGKDYDRAIAALGDYLSRPGAQGDTHYAEALALYDKSQTDREIATTRLAERRLTAARARCTAKPAANDGLLSPGQTFRDCDVAPEMVVIPGGSFMMGAAPSDPDQTPLEAPQHAVTVRSIAVGQSEVTFDEWEACVAGGGCNAYLPQHRWGRGRQPVINVSWDDAQAYVAWLGKITGKHYRLLSEAEWEYAARAGSSARYPTGDSLPPRAANFGNPDGTIPVRSTRPNAFKLYDMLGNLWEWTQDCSNPNYQGAPADGSAWESGDCRARMFRGGCWYNLAPALRVSFRFAARQDSRNIIIGLRVARDIEVRSASR